MAWSDYRDNLEWHFNPQMVTPEGRDRAERARVALSEDARRGLTSEADVRYGSGPCQLLDYFPATAQIGRAHV